MLPTKKQAKLLANIWRFKNQHQVYPSFSEIKDMMGVTSFQSVVDMLSRLEDDGWISKKAGKARSVFLTRESESYLASVGVGQMLNIDIEMDHYSFNKVLPRFFDSTHSDHNRAVANTSINYHLPNKQKEDPVPQQMSLFGMENMTVKSTATTNSVANTSFNSAAISWFTNILDASSTTIVTQIKQFAGNFFQGSLVQFVLLKRLTNFSFSEIVLVVALSLIVFPIFINLVKEKYVISN
jgi:SOS-response transcriptional repressor LexA